MQPIFAATALSSHLSSAATSRIWASQSGYPGVSERAFETFRGLRGSFAFAEGDGDPELGERGGAVPVLVALGAVGGGVGGSGQADPCGAGGFVPFLAAVAGSFEKFEFAEPGELRIVHFQDFVAIFQHVYFNFPKFALLL